MINKINLLTATAVLSLFSACGGGGGGGRAIVDNSEYKKSVGDAFTYFYTDTSNANVQTSYFLTRNYTPVSSDQSYVNDQTYSNNNVKRKYKFDKIQTLSLRSIFSSLNIFITTTFFIITFEFFFFEM